MEKMNINITTEYIKLDQLLKFSALAESRKFSPHCR